MLTQHLFRQLNEPVHSARSLHDTRTGYGCNDDVDDIGWRSTWLQAETENENGETDARDGTECKTAIAGTHPKGTQHDEQLQNHNKRHSTAVNR